MAFIEKANDIGDIFSKALKKTLTDPDELGRGLELLVRGATLPDPDDSTGDFRATGRALGRFRQEQRKRDQEDIAAANAAQRKAEEAAKLKEYAFKTSELDRRLGVEVGLAKLKEKGEEERFERDYKLRGAENTRNIAKDALDNWMNFAANTDKIPSHMWGVRDEKGKYKPTSYAIDVFTKAKLFGFGERLDYSSRDALESSRDKRNKQQQAFNKFMKAAVQRYNTEQKKLELDATPKTTVEKRLPNQVDINRPIKTIFGRFTPDPHLVDKSTVANKKDPIAGMMAVHAPAFLRSTLRAAITMSQAGNVTDKEIAAAGFRDREKFNDFVKNFNDFKTTTSLGKPLETKDIKRQAGAFTEIIRASGLERHIAAALNSIKKGETSEGRDSSGTNIKTTVTHLGYFKRNDMWAEVALNLGVLDEANLAQIKQLKEPEIEAKAETADGTSAKATASSPMAARAMAVAGALQTQEVKNLANSSSKILQEKYTTFIKKVKREYPNADLGVKENLFFEFTNLLGEMDPDGKKFLDRGGNVYKLATMFIHQGMPIGERKLDPLTEQATFITFNRGTSLEKTDRTPTTMGQRLMDAQKNTNKLFTSIDRLRGLMNASRADFTKSGGIPAGSSVEVLMGRASEAGLSFESFTKFFASMKGVVSSFTNNLTGLDAIKSEFLNYDKIDTKKKFGFTVQHNPNTTRILNEHDTKFQAGNRDILKKYNAVMEDTASTDTDKMKAQDTFLRRAAILWEKTALTYQLAGYVQGEQTGGRTISNQDFDNIYKALWGGTFYSEDSARNALRILSFTTQQMSQRLIAEKYALTSLGHGLAGDDRLRSITNAVYSKRWDKFLENDEVYQKELDKERTAEGQSLAETLQRVHVVSLNVRAGEAEMNLTNNFYTPRNVGKASALTKTILNFSNLKEGSRPVRAGDSKGAYKALDKMFNIVQNPESDEYKFANEVTDNILKMFKNPVNNLKAQSMVEEYGPLGAYQKLFTDVHAVKELLTSGSAITREDFLEILQGEGMGDMVLKFFKADPALFNFYQIKFAPTEDI